MMMELFKKFFTPKEVTTVSPIKVEDDAIVSIADGIIIDKANVSDPVFAQEMMGKTLVYQFDGDSITLCSPANGSLSVVFPTGHAFGITTNEGVELLVHCGVNTVEAGGNGFKLLKKETGKPILAGEPVLEVDLKQLRTKYDMSTMLIVVNENEKDIEFISPQPILRGESVAHYIVKI